MTSTTNSHRAHVCVDADALPVRDILGALVDALASAIAPRVADLVVARMQATVANDVPALPTGLVDKTTAARAIGVSIATLDRLVREGAPVDTIGTRRRFDIAELRAWTKARGRKPTTPTPRPPSTPEPDDDEIAELALAAGIRRA